MKKTSNYRLIIIISLFIAILSLSISILAYIKINNYKSKVIYQQESYYKILPNPLLNKGELS